jgi:DNA polymerase I-like protein with 3'-5' exonuclease and polymerase domains
LEKQGIKELGECNPRRRPRPGTFEFRVKEVEELFWKKRFTVYDQWKKDWFAAFQKNGGFKTLTGFWIGAIGGKQGLLKRNDVSNWPIQGAAFHCLLWTLIQLTKEIRKRKMKTKVVGQIHDSVIADVPEREIQDYLEMAKRIMTVDLPKAWTWINVPLDTEAEVCPLGGSWHTKAVWEKVGGVWCPKKKK